MPAFSSTELRGIVFDLDGTLYVSDRFASEIKNASIAYIAECKGISHADAGLVMGAARQRLTEESGMEQTISAVCAELGGSVQELHRFFVQHLRPEAYLVRNKGVIQMLERLSVHFSLHIYTNNNRILATRILDYLGLDSVVHALFTIDDTWQNKPDEGMAKRVLEQIGLAPNEALFVGDRYDIDLRVPEQLGCPVYLSQSLEQLLRLEELLIPATFADTSATPADPPAVLL